MSISSVRNIMVRIAGAAPISPIAVFDIGEWEFADAVFAATVVTQSRLARSDLRLIGVFDNTMPLRLVRDQIEARLGDNCGDAA